MSYIKCIFNNYKNFFRVTIPIEKMLCFACVVCCPQETYTSPNRQEMQECMNWIIQKWEQESARSANWKAYHRLSLQKNAASVWALWAIFNEEFKNAWKRKFEFGKGRNGMETELVRAEDMQDQGRIYLIQNGRRHWIPSRYSIIVNIHLHPHYG